MSDPSLAVPDVASVPAPGSLRRLLRNPLGVAAIGWLALVLVSALLASWLSPYDPDEPAARDILAGPGSAHLLGADGSGRDILSRLLHASQISVAGAALTLLVAAVIGIGAGLLAGYYGGWTETAGTWVASLIMALPGIVALLAVRAVVGPSLWTTMAIFGVLLSPAFYRVVHAAVSGVRNELYVDAARVSGLSDPRIIGRHVLTVVRAPAIILAAGVGSAAIALQSGITFLGLGDPSVPTWGGMLNDAFANIYTAPVALAWPSLAIGVTCVALTLLSNALRDALERTAEPAPTRHDADDEHAAPPAPSGGEALLEVRDLVVAYRRPDGSARRVVDEVSLSVREGEVHGLVGESGSGKTQTAFSILRLLPAGARTSGSIVFDGTELTGLPAKRLTRLRGDAIAYIPQEPMSNLDPSFTVGSQLVEPIRTHRGYGRAQARARALELLDRVGIPDPERTFRAYPHEISGGMAQRVLIAGAVACEPKLLIADEPTTALDVTVQAEVLDLLRDLRDDLGMGVLLVTHDFGVVADLCDRVSVMRHGRVVETGPVDALFAAPQHPYTRALFDAVIATGEPAGSPQDGADA
ncbi:dipeptide/oligopeptide/nickel ABC transporter permease/ATP-binding protein [Actinomadura rayongensis]|uniref:ATP-binding cassette domain-containing protein n=1 Tax=Actinomadura rayongensis TaxID=1429076 RepID=A0A6I4WD55_9ACTN|nr:dipeptide/oligopeptide/nickel ABC transporter permease/ATP-binding protein [Actinomadura rayongensis]MXQ65766.1 ATP-binding cassette domain-containing protein [Actinomadura rayongensis]